MSRPEYVPLNELSTCIVGETVIWTYTELVEKVSRHYDYSVVEFPNEPTSSLDTLLVIGGGMVIDRAKLWRKQNCPKATLIAIPSIWGSGAENTPISVLNVDGKKEIFVGEDLLPDVRAVWPELAESLPDNLVRFACGDTWAHALEGFLSPIAGKELRSDLAKLINVLISTPIANSPEWFELSAQAAAGQAQSSVGLIHGLAHVLEGEINKSNEGTYIGHAQLCSTFLWPVLQFNVSMSDRIEPLFLEFEIDKTKVFNIAKQLFDKKVYELVLHLLEAQWRNILRSPTTRTNCTLVRPNHSSYFMESAFN